MKKALSLFLALVLCLSLSVPAFAAVGDPAPNANPFFVLNLSDGVWSVRIDPADIYENWTTEWEYGATNTSLEIAQDADGMIVYSVEEGRFFPGDTVVETIRTNYSMTVPQVFLNFSTDSKPQFPSHSVAQQYGFFDPEQYGIAAPTCSDWAEEDIIAALDLGLLPQAVQYDYSKPITRLEFAQIAMNFCGLQYRCSGTDACILAAQYYGPLQNKLANPFDTLTLNDDLLAARFDDCSDYDLRYARIAGLINGVGDNRFEPDREITRAEAATMLLNAYRVYTGDMYDENSTLLTDLPELTYADADAIEDWAQAPAALMTQWGVMKGIEDNKFDPAGFYTREQCIVTFMRMWRDAPVSRGKGSASLCPYTCEELLEFEHAYFQTLDPSFVSEEPLLENDSVVVYALSSHGLPPGGNGAEYTIFYKTGGWHSLKELLANYDFNNNLANPHPGVARYSDISLDEEANLLTVTLQRRSDRMMVTMTIDLDTDRVISVVEAEET